MPITVNGENVEETLIAHERAHLSERYAVLPDAGSEEWKARVEQDAIENAVERLLLIQAAREQLGPPPEKRVSARLADLGIRAPEADEALRARVADDVRYEALLEGVTREVAPPDEAECRAYFEADPQRYEVPETVHAAHILQAAGPGRSATVVWDNLQAARRELLSGADFAAVAQRYSDCPDAGGDLGFFPRGRMVPAFDQVVFGLEPGAVSDIFWTDFGFHIAKVFERRPPRPRSFDEAKELIREHLHTERKEACIGELVDELRKKAQVDYGKS